MCICTAPPMCGYKACCLYMCKQGHAACACVNRVCCVYMCEYIYMKMVGNILFMSKRFLMLLHVYTDLLTDHA